MDPKHLHVTREILTKEAIEFGEWLSRECVRAAARRRRLSERDARAETLRIIMEVIQNTVMLTYDDEIISEENE
ncbi:unnamed protein product [Colias eurytheme]|nr:unnamed protein product [Colias eurytheme]